MVYSISDAVGEILDELTFLDSAIEYDLLNYSALARFIQPAVSSKLGEQARPEAVTVAVRRYLESSRRRLKSVKFLEVIRTTKLILRTDLAMLIVRQWVDVGFLEDVKSLIPEVDFRAGEKLYVLCRSNELLIICDSRFLSTLESKVRPPARIEEKQSGVALITMNIQHADFDVPGILQFFVKQFDLSGINIYDVFSTRGKITFIFSQSDAAKAYECVSSAIEATRSMPFSGSIKER